MNGVFIFIEWLASVNEMVCGFVWTQEVFPPVGSSKWENQSLPSTKLANETLAA